MRRSPADRPVVAGKPLLAGVGVEPRGRLIWTVRSFNRGCALGGSEEDMPTSQVKPFDIPKQMVWEAYRQVTANKGAPGVDGQTLGEFEADLKNNLYKIWNRMCSGTYFPPPVGRWRYRNRTAAGSGCSACRLSLTGLPRRWSPCIWRSGRNRCSTPTPMATGRAGRPWTRSAACRQRCWKYDWVIDLDVQKFFDSVPWDLVVKAVEAVTDAPLGAAVCEAVAGCAASAARRHPC